MAAKIANVGIIGAGRIGKVHAATVAYRIPTARILAIADVNGEAARQVAAQFGIPTTVDDPAVVLENKDIDAVLVCSSTDTHAKFTVAGSEGGQTHLLREAHRPRPGTTSTGRWRRREGRCQSSDRLPPPLRPELRPGATGRRLGRDRHTRASHIISRVPARRPFRRRVAGGVWFDMTIHDLDMARCLVGAEGWRSTPRPA